MTPPHILSATAVIQITNVGNKFTDYAGDFSIFVCVCHISACKLMRAYFSFTGLIG